MVTTRRSATAFQSPRIQELCEPGSEDRTRRKRHYGGRLYRGGTEWGFEGSRVAATAKELPTPEPVGTVVPVLTQPTQDVTVVGRLEWASSLNQESIRIETDEGAVDRVSVPPGLMDDIVKPLWNEKVVIKGKRKPDGVILLVRIDPAVR